MSDSRAVTVALSSAGETGSRAESLYTIIFLALIGVLSDNRSAHQHPSAGCGALSWELEANEENITAKRRTAVNPAGKVCAPAGELTENTGCAVASIPVWTACDDG